MIFYLLPFFAFLLYLFDKLKINQYRHLNLGVFCLILAISIVGMFRGKGIGSDYYSYEIIFNFEDNIEYLFLQIIKLVKKIGGGYTFFISFIFAVSFFIKLSVFKKMSLNPLLSLMIYLGFWFLVYDMNGIRQGLALSLTLLGTYSIWKGKILYYWICIISAVLIHSSAVVFIPFVYVYLKKNTFRSILVILILAFILALNGGIIGVLEYLFNLLGLGYFIDKLFSYSINDSFNSNVLLSFTTIHRLFIWGVLYIYIPKMQCDERLKNIFVWAATINLVIYLLFSNIEIVATRISLYYRFIECISLACIPSAILQNKSQVCVSLLLLVYVFWQIYSTLSMDNNNLIPFYLNI